MHTIKDSSSRMASLENYTKHLRKEIILILTQILPENRKKDNIPQFNHDARKTLTLKPDKNIMKKKDHRTILLVNIHAKILNKMLTS